MDRHDRRPTKARLDVEALEGRAVLTTGGVSMLATPVGTSLLQGLNYLYVQGNGHGTILQARANPDTGTTDVLLGSGKFQGLGPELITGKLQGTGFIARGNLGGEITLSDARGSVTLKLDGPSASVQTPPRSGLYHFSVEKGTGGHAHDVGSGTVKVTLGAKTFGLVFHGKPNNA